MATIADTIRAGLAAGKTNDEILADVKKNHPNANTSPACVSYYRSKAKKAGNLTTPKAPKPTAKKKKVEKLPAPLAPQAPAVGHGYTLAKYKPFGASWGGGFDAVLMKDGVEVASVFDKGDGGCYGWHWKVKGEEALYMDFVKAKYGAESFEPDDAFINDCIDTIELTKQARNALKKVVYELDGKLYTSKPQAHETLNTVIAIVKSKNPTARILNNEPIEVLVEMLRAQQG